MPHDFSYLDAQPPQDRTAGLYCRLSPAELQAIRDGAAEAGLSQADYVVTATRLLRDLRGIADGRGVPLGKLVRKL
jgi:hypothetical protein